MSVIIVDTDILIDAALQVSEAEAGFTEWGHIQVMEASEHDDAADIDNSPNG